MASTGDEYRLKWQTHVRNLCTEFLELRKNESYVDVTLVCRGGQIRAHRLLLSACSPLLERLLADNHQPEATLILPDLQVSCVRSLIEYVYTGEISVHDSEIDRLVDAANMLEMRGIALAVPPSATKRPRPSLTLPVPAAPFVFPSPLSAGLTSPILASPVKSLLRRNLTAGGERRRCSPPLKRRCSPEEEDARNKAPRRQDVGARRCSTPLFVDTNGGDAGRRQSSSHSDLSDGSEQQRVTTTTCSDIVDDSVSSLNSSFVSEAEASLLNPQVELSEGAGRVRVKTEMTSPMTSPAMCEALDGTAGSCVFCKKHFVSADDLKDHISRVHVTDKLEKQFKCDYCPAAFARSAHLKRHVRTHTGERPYACGVCPRAFSRQDKLKCHMDRHTEDERRKVQTPDGSSLPSPTTSMQSYLRSLNRGLALASPRQAALTLDQLYPCPLPSLPPGSSNPGLPYLQTILDDVQIVRDKKPASYYRNIKRSSSESLLSSVRRLGECTIKVATPVE